MNIQELKLKFLFRIDFARYVNLDGSGSDPVEGIRVAKLFGKDASEVAKAYETKVC